MRNQTPHLKKEPQNSEQSMYIQQQQQLLQMSRQSSQAAASAQINMLQQHRLLQIQQPQQQHQLLKAVPQQRPQMQQQFQAQNLPLRSPVKPVHEVGACARRVTQYIYQQRNRPEDNNIEFWKKFVAEFFAPSSVKKWCVSMYGNGRQTTGVFPQDLWHCEICNRKPGRGFEATFEVLPRLFKIKYESGTLEELLYIDMPREYHNPSGQIVLDYAKAIQESVFEQLRVVRDGQLRIIFSPDLKICSWEFCARHHEELIPRRLLIPQVSQLGAAAQKYQATTQNASVSDLQGNCNMFLASAKLLAKALEAPSVNDLGYSKRYVRCLQISEVVNSMKDLIDYSRVTGTGPIESLAKFPRRNASSGLQKQIQQSDDQQQQQQLQQQNMLQNSNGEQPSTCQAAGMQHATSYGNTDPTASRAQNPINSANSPYSTTSMQPPPFRSPTPPPSNNSPLQQPHSNNGLSNATAHINTANSPVNVSMQQQQQSGDPADSQSSVHKIIQEMMLNGQLNSRGGISNDMKNVNGALNNGNPGLRFSGMGGNQIATNGRVGSIGRDQGMSHHQQQNLSNQLSGFGSVNGFNNLHFDWKPSP